MHLLYLTVNFHGGYLIQGNQRENGVAVGMRIHTIFRIDAVIVDSGFFPCRMYRSVLQDDSERGHVHPRASLRASSQSSD